MKNRQVIELINKIHTYADLCTLVGSLCRVTDNKYGLGRDITPIANRSPAVRIFVNDIIREYTGVGNAYYKNMYGGRFRSRNCRDLSSYHDILHKEFAKAVQSIYGSGVKLNNMPLRDILEGLSVFFELL